MEYGYVGGLEASEDYWLASSHRRAANCNGAGTAGWRGAFVPDTIYGLDINPSANIHDWDYAEGTTMKDKVDADFRFFQNMLTQVSQQAARKKHRYILKLARSYRCFLYYLVLRETDESVAAFKAAELI